MNQTNFGSPTQYETSSITIDGEDIVGIFFSISLFEDIYRPCVTGNITIVDSEGATDQGSFIEKNDIEFIEPIEFEFKNASGESLKFEGVLNGLRNEYIKAGIKYYCVDFTSNSVRENEKKFITKSFKNKAPQDIVKEMIKEVGGKMKNNNGSGKNMQYLGARRRPLDIVKYVCTHGLTQEAQATESEDKTEEKSKGTTGFLCWETIDGYNFASIKDIKRSGTGTNHTDYKTILANRSLSMDELMKSIVKVDFDQIGDFQTKLRSGAFGGRNISFDMDTGIYKEYTYYNKENMTKKQKEAFGDEGTVSRYYYKPNSNQKFTNKCEKAQPLHGDQSRAYLGPESGGQNTFSDQTGHFTLYPSFKMRAGDMFTCQLNKIKGERADGGSDKKHSGRYIIQAVGHHIFQDGKAYTRIKTIRSTTQQTETSSRS